MDEFITPQVGTCTIFLR